MRTFRWAATSTLCGVLVVGPFGRVAGQAPSDGFGSMVPCRTPMSWTVTSVDPRFGLTRDQALAAVRRAAGLWEDAAEARLFDVREDGADAYPISFEYDDRQATLDVRRRLRAELDSIRADIEGRRRLLEDESRRFDSASAEYQEDAESHRRAMTAYNATVSEWNQRGGAPSEVRAELEARLTELNRIRDGLRRREADLRQLSEWLQAEVEQLNRRIVDLQRREERFVRERALAAAESGRYDETVTWEGDRVRSLARRIRVFQFTDPDNLVLVLAHEMGHALGLGHAAGRGAIMSEVLETGDGAAPPAAVTEVDGRMLGRLCPSLGARVRR